MKKYLSLILILSTMLFAAAAAACSPKNTSISAEGAVKIRLSSGSTGYSAAVTDPEDVAEITAAFSSLTLVRDKSSQGYAGFAYSVAWYDEKDELLDSVVIQSGSYFNYHGWFWNVEGGSLELDLIGYYLNPYYRMPADSELEFWITEDVGGVDFTGYEQRPGWFGAYEYYGKGYRHGDTEYISYLICAYPDYADGGSFVTRITVTDPKVKILGDLTTTSSPEQWSAALENLGCYPSGADERLDEGTNYKCEWHSTDGKIIFTLISNAEGCEFYISAPVSNRDNIIF